MKLEFEIDDKYLKEIHVTKYGENCYRSREVEVTPSDSFEKDGRIYKTSAVHKYYATKEFYSNIESYSFDHIELEEEKGVYTIYVCYDRYVSCGEVDSLWVKYEELTTGKDMFLSKEEAEKHIDKKLAELYPDLPKEVEVSRSDYVRFGKKY